jgi:ribose 5-phosphate isomerase B
MTPMGDKTAIGSDHRGFSLKQSIISALNEMDIPVEDMGVFTEEATDYPLFAKSVAQMVSEKTCARGILICGSGIGMSIVANKFPGVRAALCHTADSARKSRMHNDANVLVLGQDVDQDTAKQMLKVWFETPFDGGRHQIRLDQIQAIEAENFKSTR